MLPILISASLWASVAYAGAADVVAVKVIPGADGSYQFDVTVRHDDTGWDHYADRWEVLGADGAVLATRILQHPHVGEQPFTRSLAGVRIPEGVRRVSVRAHDSRDGWGGASASVDLPGPHITPAATR